MSAVRASRPLGATPVRLPAAGHPLAEANRAAWQRSVDVLARLLPDLDVPALAATPPVECHRAHAEGVAGLLTVADLDRLLCTTLVPADDRRPSTPSPKLARGGATVPLDEVVHVDRGDAEGRGVRLHGYALSQALRQGASLYLSTVADHHPPLSRLVEHLRRAFGGSAQCGVFVSAAAGPAPFAEHWDATENLCLQLVGRRHWRVRRPSIADNHPGFGLGRGEAGDLAWEGDLGPGDALLVPRSWWHEVTPVDPGLSVHATIGINRPVRHDAIRWLLGRGAADAALRAPLGHVEAGGGGELLGPLRSLLDEDAETGLLAHLHAREVPATVPTTGPLALLGLADPGALVVRRLLTGHVAVGEDGLAGGGMYVEVAPDYVDVAAAALSGAPVAVADLLPLGPDVAGVLALVDHLLRLDWLTPARADEHELLG